MKVLVRLFIVLCIVLPAQAKVGQNSMCSMLDQGSGSQVHGDHTNGLFEIASVSKVVTSYWALHELGPQFRFSTHIYVTPVSRDLFDVHIEGSRDPFWGRQLTHFLFSELNKKGVSNIRRLSFDENFEMRWFVISDNIEPENPSAQEIASSLARHIRSLSAEYPRTRKEADEAGLTLPRSLRLSAQSVEFTARADFKVSSGTTALVLRSSPLYRYLKETNVVSNNHVADRIFEILGGPNRFRSFVQKQLGMDDRDLLFVNGSGNSFLRADGSKDYNKGTCEAIVQILHQMQKELKASHGMDLKDVLAVSGADGGTLSPRFDSVRNSMAAKTGTVDPAVTLAGVLSTADGDVYFGVFMDTQSAADWNNARDKIRGKVMDLFQEHGGKRSFNYVSRSFLSFDSSSALTGVEKRLEMSQQIP